MSIYQGHQRLYPSNRLQYFNKDLTLTPPPKKAFYWAFQEVFSTFFAAAIMQGQGIMLIHDMKCLKSLAISAYNRIIYNIEWDSLKIQFSLCKWDIQRWEYLGTV